MAHMSPINRILLVPIGQPVLLCLFRSKMPEKKKAFQSCLGCLIRFILLWNLVVHGKTTLKLSNVFPKFWLQQIPGWLQSRQLGHSFQSLYNCKGENFWTDCLSTKTSTFQHYFVRIGNFNLPTENKDIFLCSPMSKTWQVPLLCC